MARGTSKWETWVVVDIVTVDASALVDEWQSEECGVCASDGKVRVLNVSVGCRGSTGSRQSGESAGAGREESQAWPHEAGRVARGAKD